MSYRDEPDRDQDGTGMQPEAKLCNGCETEHYDLEAGLCVDCATAKERREKAQQLWAARALSRVKARCEALKSGRAA